MGHRFTIGFISTWPVYQGTTMDRYAHSLIQGISADATGQNYYAGSAAVTHNTFGKGNAFYAGTIPDNNGMQWLIEQVCKTAGI